MRAEAERWARETFGRADLGDKRRVARLVGIAAGACERPSGRVASVFESDREREGAYDFLENDEVAPAEIERTIARATLSRAANLPFVFVPVDGTSITVVDRTKKRDFGDVGTDKSDARGLKIVDALAVDPEGTVVGWLGLTFWARSPDRKKPSTEHARKSRPVEEKETRYWIETVRSAVSALDEGGKRGWFQIDREGDGHDLLLALAATKHWWTVRGNADRSIELEDGDTTTLRTFLAQTAPVGSYELAVTATQKRTARRARMTVHIGRARLRLRDARTHKITPLEVSVAWAREDGTTPAGEDPIDWLLYTNRDVHSFEDATVALYGYAQRWRVEECHRTWKRGECDIESTQLRSVDAVHRWALILAAVATRIERLKRLARERPTQPATAELTVYEVRALKILRFKARAHDEPDPTIGQAVAWIAEMGGYANKYSGKPPGATVLGRGLRRLRAAADLLIAQESGARAG